MKNLSYFVLFLLPLSSYSQINLVPNPSFELYNMCPNNQGQINKSISWFQPFIGPNGSSTDYFNNCAPNTTLVSVPNNASGFQLAKNGNAYAGIFTYGVSNYREYLETELSDTLIGGLEYCVSFYVSLCDMASVAADGLGAYFSNSSIFYSSPPYGLLPYSPQVENVSGNIITDTINWVHVQGSFIAAGGERFMTIGNFNSDNLTDTSTSNTNSWSVPASYYYIDLISVIQGSCNVGISELNSQLGILNIYPNPTSGVVYFKSGEYSSIEIFDSFGRLMLITCNKKEVDISNFQNGVYYVKLRFENNTFVYRKILLSN